MAIRYVYYRPTDMTYRPSGMGQGDVTDALTSAVSAKLSPAIAQAAQAAAPIMKELVVSYVLPAVLIAMVAGAAVSAAVGSYFATRRSNPPRARRAYGFRSRRYAA